MGRTLLFAVVASSPLILGAYLGARFTFPERLLAAVLAFAAGALITALTFELFEESFEKGGALRAAVGLAAGAVVFTGASVVLDRYVAKDDDPDGSTKLDKDAAARERPATSASVGGGAGLALLAAVTLDGVPENAALGISLETTGGSLALLAAIFASNLPESLVGAASMRAQGRSTTYAVGLWSVAAVLLTGAVLVGAGPLSSVSDQTISLPLAFAAGAVIASLADTLMPEAYEKGGPLVALSTALGFVLSFLLATL
ncbi:MAG: zinc permease [Actinobacteria bacterium]|nr:zinc permease [Actinomycetota bacterium]